MFALPNVTNYKICVFETFENGLVLCFNVPHNFKSFYTMIFEFQKFLYNSAINKIIYGYNFLLIKTVLIKK